MSLSSEFLKKLGVPEEDFTKLVKYGSAAHDRFVARCRNIRSGYGYTEQAISCCGMGEISGSSAESIQGDVARSFASGFQGVVYYSVNDRITKKLLEMGFKEVAVVPNNLHGHKTRISVLIGTLE